MKILASLLLTIGLVGCGESPASLLRSGPTSPSQPIGIQGVVYDSAFRPISGARVEVVDGPHAGGSVVADTLGRFSFDGAFAERTQLRASGAGHDSATVLLPPKCASCNAPLLYFYLAVSGAAIDVLGDYTLTFIADHACSEQLPAPLLERTYLATIVAAATPALPAGTSFQVNVSGAPFLATHDKFALHLAGNYRSLYLGDYEPGLVELIGENTGLGLGGWATGWVDANAPMGLSLDGYAHYCPVKSPITSWLSCGEAAGHQTCFSKNHRLVLTKR